MRRSIRFAPWPTLLLLAALNLAGCVNIRQEPVPDSVAARALDAARSQAGSAYVWGGQKPGGFDCSGLIVWAYEQALPSLRLALGGRIVADATVDELWRYDTSHLALDQIRPGDIVFIGDSGGSPIAHAGIFAEWVDTDTFKFIDASSYYGKVVVDTWPVSGTKRGQKFVGAGRIEAAH